MTSSDVSNSTTSTASCLPCPSSATRTDSKTTSGPRLGLSPTAWAAFLAHVTK
ncbi:DUF397 domain-containing protein [Streptomyces albogriseolus]|uniref:DUF397 domain-containing protein n=1 Tax=Streptomyces albogriseolus TaxID=1887 RepID=UPI0036FDE7EB